MKIGIELDPEVVSNIVYEDLMLTRECFMEDLEADRPGVFSCNPAYDKAQIIKHIEALDIVLSWYQPPV